MNIKTIAVVTLLLAFSISQRFPSFNSPSCIHKQYNRLKQFSHSTGSHRSGSDECCDSSTISVSGFGTVDAQPDQAIISSQLRSSQKTTQRAIDSLTQLVDEVSTILKANGLSRDNYRVTSFNTYANTSWKDGVSTVLGQIAQQSFQITLPSIQQDGSNIGKLIDQLAVVNGIVLNGLSFELSNKTTVFELARKKAFENAREKAVDYSEALNLQLGDVVRIKDSVSSAPVVNDSSSQGLKLAGDNSATTVNVGTIPISYNMEAIYSFTS